MSMNKASLTLLTDEPMLRALAATWPRVSHGADDENEHWSRISGVPVSVVIESRPLLFENEICLPDGTTDQNALLFITGRALRVDVKRSKGQK